MKKPRSNGAFSAIYEKAVAFFSFCRHSRRSRESRPWKELDASRGAQTGSPLREDDGESCEASVAKTPTTLTPILSRLRGRGPHEGALRGLLQQTLKQLAHLRRVAGDVKAALFHDGELGVCRVSAA